MTAERAGALNTHAWCRIAAVLAIAAILLAGIGGLLGGVYLAGPGVPVDGFAGISATWLSYLSYLSGVVLLVAAYWVGHLIEWAMWRWPACRPHPVPLATAHHALRVGLLGSAIEVVVATFIISLAALAVYFGGPLAALLGPGWLGDALDVALTAGLGVIGLLWVRRIFSKASRHFGQPIAAIVDTDLLLAVDDGNGGYSGYAVIPLADVIRVRARAQGYFHIVMADLETRGDGQVTWRNLEGNPADTRLERDLAENFPSTKPQTYPRDIMVSLHGVSALAPGRKFRKAVLSHRP